MDVKEMLLHVATVWAPGRNDGFGKLDYSDVTPRTVCCRWQDVQELFRDAQGREVVSNAVVYTTVPCVVDSYVFLGETAATSPQSLPGAYKVLRVSRSPSLDGTSVLFKVTV